jgi:hypothetical protein
MPAGFEYPALPPPAVERVVTLTVPIHVVCGSDSPVGDFVPDPNMLDGQANHTDAAVDASAPNAAPAAVYQSERYGNDFTYEFPVPKNRRYTVRLHFAEVFDHDPGQRIENVAVNGKTVLQNLDIIAAAGGTHKALVRSFHDVSSGAAGIVTVRVWAAPKSTDQNAKISAIEILAE